MIQNWNLRLSGMKRINIIYYVLVTATVFIVFYGGYKMTMEQVRIQMLHHNYDTHFGMKK